MRSEIGLSADGSAFVTGGGRSPLRGRGVRWIYVVVLAAALTVPVGVLASSGRAPLRALAGSSRTAARSAYGHLPLAFAPNRGQFSPSVLFAARGTGYGLFLTRRAAVLDLAAAATRGGHPTRTGTVSLGFAGASSHARLSGASAMTERVNYLIGKRADWHTGIPTYARVRYAGLWPGVSAVFYGRQGRLEYDFDVAAGADPGRIGLTVGGARSVRVAQDGSLVLSLPGGSLRQLVPHAYQLVGGARHAVQSRYVLRGNRVGIAVGRYDHSRPLVIDPALVYSTYLGGTGTDTGEAIAVDSSGAAYVVGHTDGGLPTTTGAFQGTYGGGGEDAFVAKLAPNGSSLDYATYLGGSNYDYGYGVAVDSAGDAFVAGQTESTDFPTTTGAYRTTFPGSPSGDAGFVTKLSPTGSSLLYSTYLGATSTSAIYSIAIDSSGAAYVTGFTLGGFPTTAGAAQTTFGGSDDAFVTKLAPDGSSLEYSTYLGGSGSDYGFAIAVDSAGAAYVTGGTNGGFPTTSGAAQTTFGGANDAYVTKVAPGGESLAYSTYLGGSDYDTAVAIAVGSSGAAYVTGYTRGGFPTTTGAYQTTYGGGGDDGFVTELTPAGSSVAYSTYLGGPNFDAGYAIALDSAGAAYVTGEADGSGYPTTSGAYQTAFGGGGGDAVLTKLAPDGRSLAYSTYLGGPNYDAGYGIAVDSTGAAYLTGESDGSGFPTTSGAYQTTFGGGGADGFVSKFSGSPVAVTGPASKITPACVTLHGTVNPGGDSTTYHFEYGRTTAYGSKTATTSAGSGSAAVSVSVRVCGLRAHTSYHYRLVAVNSSGTSNGADRRFTTAVPKLKLAVSPHSTRAGHLTCFAFTASSGGRAVGGVRVRLAGHSALSSKRGKARICVSLSAGRHTATASKTGYRSANAVIRVTSAAKPPPSFTG